MVIGEAGIILVGHEKAPVQAETAAATIQDYYFPFGFIVLEWGVVLSEDFVAQATDWVVSISKLDKLGGTVTSIDTLAVGSSNTNLYKGNGVKEAQTLITADADLDNGHVILGSRSSMPHYASAHTILRTAVDTAATGAGGAGVVFAFVKPLLDARSAKAWIDIS